MDRNELREWLGGPVTHTHLRSEADPNFFDGTERHQFTQEAALHYLRLLTGNPDARITDTNHALIDFDVDNLDRPKSIPKEEWRNKIVAEASTGTLTRLAKVRQNPNAKNVIIGVEADIIDDEGGLSLNNDCLSQLDFTIASFHSFIWSAFSEEHDYTKQYLLKSYENVVKNPNVVVLGHATKTFFKNS